MYAQCPAVGLPEVRLPIGKVALGNQDSTEDIIRSNECKAVDRSEAQEGAGGQIIGLVTHDNSFDPLQELAHPRCGGHIVHDRNVLNLRRPRARGLVLDGNRGRASTHLAIPKLNREELQFGGVWYAGHPLRHP